MLISHWIFLYVNREEFDLSSVYSFVGNYSFNFNIMWWPAPSLAEGTADTSVRFTYI